MYTENALLGNKLQYDIQNIGIIATNIPYLIACIETHSMSKFLLFQIEPTYNICVRLVFGILCIWSDSNRYQHAAWK